MFKTQAEYVQCPYDSSHRILKSRFQVHLGRCRKSYKNDDLVTCPFYAVHKIHKPELDWHVSVCEHRASFELFKHCDASIVGQRVETQPVEVQPQKNYAAAIHQQNAPPEQVSSEYPLDMDENWDNLPNVPTYNPQKYVLQAPVLRILQGQSKSVKKQFRAEERRRLLNIQ